MVESGLSDPASNILAQDRTGQDGGVKILIFMIWIVILTVI